MVTSLLLPPPKAARAEPSRLRLQVSAAPPALESVRQGLYDLALDGMDWTVDEDMRLVLSVTPPWDTGPLLERLSPLLLEASEVSADGVDACVEEISENHTVVVTHTWRGLARAAGVEAPWDSSALVGRADAGKRFLQVSRQHEKALLAASWQRQAGLYQEAMNPFRAQPDLTQPLQWHPLVPAQALYTRELDLSEQVEVHQASPQDDWLEISGVCGFTTLLKPRKALASLKEAFSMSDEHLLQLMLLLATQLVAQHGYRTKTEKAFIRVLEELATTLPGRVRLSQTLQVPVCPANGDLWFEGAWFTNVAELARHHGLAPQHLNRRIRQGRTLAQGLDDLLQNGVGHSRAPRGVWVGTTRHPSLRAAAKALGLANPSSLPARANRGKYRIEGQAD